MSFFALSERRTRTSPSAVTASSMPPRPHILKSLIVKQYEMQHLFQSWFAHYKDHVYKQYVSTDFVFWLAFYITYIHTYIHELYLSSNLQGSYETANIFDNNGLHNSAPSYSFLPFARAKRKNVTQLQFGV
jgi:hypothetical protein